MELDEKRLLELAEDVLDILSDMPENEVRRIFDRNTIPKSVDFQWTIGGTEYSVEGRYDRQAYESLTDKLKRLLEYEVSA